jgi:hypothetical protein
MDEEQNYQRMQKEEKNWNRLFTTILICLVTPRNERDPRVVKKDGGRAPPRDAAVIFFFFRSGATPFEIGHRRLTQLPLFDQVHEPILKALPPPRVRPYPTESGGAHVCLSDVSSRLL